LTFYDDDLLETHSITSIANPSGALGLLTASISQDTTFSDSPGVIEWAYSVNELFLEHLAEGETKLEGFKISLSDGEVGEVVISLQGTNDNPASAGYSTGSITEDSQVLTAEGYQFWVRDLQESGSFEFGDPDFSDQHFVSNVSSQNGNLGYLHASMAADTDEAGGAGLIDWDYSVVNSSIEYLAAGETLSESFIVTVSDDHGATFDHEIDITINGTNDGPVITQSDTYGTVKKINDTDPGRQLYDHGFIHFTDFDLSDSHEVSVSSMDTIGDITAVFVEDSTGSGNGVIEWEYSAYNSALTDLSAGRGKVENFRITLDDGQGGTTYQDVSVYINSGDLYQTSETFSASFFANDQSMWGSDDTDLFNFGHDEFWGLDDVITGDIDKDLGVIDVAAGYYFDYKAGLQSVLGAGTGTVDAGLEYDFNIDSKFDPAEQSLIIRTSANQTSGEFDTDFAGFSYEASLIFDFWLDWYAYFDVAGERIHVPSPELRFDNSVTLIDLEIDSIDTTSSGFGGSYSSTGRSNNFFSYDLDILDLLLIPLIGDNPFHYEKDLGILDLDLTLASPEIYAEAYLGQDFQMTSVTPAGVITLERIDGLPADSFEFTFGESLEIIDTAQYKTDDDGNIIYKIDVDPTAKFDSTTTIDADVEFTFNALEFSLGYDVGFDQGSYAGGPYFTYEPDPYKLASIELFKDDFYLDFNDASYESSLKTAPGNMAPYVENGEFYFIKENQGPVSIGTSRASDYDGDRLFFDIVSGNEAGYFSIDRYTGELYAIQSLDYEHDARQYDLGVEVIDYEGAISIYTASVELQNVLEGISITGAPPSEITLDENGPVISLGTLSARDPDETNITYSISAGNDDHLFYINPDTGELLVNSLDYEQATEHNLVLTAEDADGESAYLNLELS